MIHLENKFGIKISTEFVDFIEQEVLPETTILADKFWAALQKSLRSLLRQISNCWKDEFIFNIK